MGSGQSCRSVDTDRILQGKVYTYTTEVYTSSKTLWKTAGTDDNAYLTVHGTDNKTERKKLDKRFHDDLEAGSVDSYKVEGPDVGEILYVALEKEGNDDWHLEKIAVSSENGSVVTFPFYNWVPEKVKIRSGKAMLPQHESNEELKKIRQEELAVNSHVYQFNTDYQGLPGSIAVERHMDLPRNIQFHDAKSNDYQHNVDKAMIKFGISTLLETFDKWKTPEKLADIVWRFSKGEDLAMLNMLIERWDEDTEFGRQMLNGVHPVMIQRCNKFLDNFPVTDEMVKPFLMRSESLEDEMKNGHIYYVNYEDLVGLPRFSKGKDVRYCANPLLLLYVRPSGELVPIAIKLDQEDGPIWTPQDGLGWTLAKIYVKNADIQIYQMGSHLMKTHFVTESISVALFRNFSFVHPVYKMLLPHTKHTIAINTMARTRFVQPGGIVEKSNSVAGDGVQLKLASKLYRKRFQWDDLNVPKNMVKRGVDDTELLPNYHYRDDAILLWDAILNFIRNMAGIYYKLDADVTSDVELQSFMKEIHDEGFPFDEGDLDKGFPDSLTNVDDLCTVLTMIIFNCSCQHAAINFSQFQNMSYPTNYPLALRQPPPENKFDVTVDDIMLALPDKKLTAAAVMITYVPSQFADNEVFLGDYPEELFTEEEVKQVQATFRDCLKEVSVKIHKRNEGCDVKYRYLLPERIPSSVAV